MRTTSRISFISIIFITAILLIMSYFNVINDTLITLITVITAIIGAFGIWLELNKEQEINQAEFILQIHNSFYALGGSGTEYTAELEKRLDDDFSGKEKLVLTKEDDIKVVQYLVWLKTLSSLINRNMIKLSAVDDLFAYKFFVAVNNIQFQNKELIPYSTAYKGIYKTHKLWKKYRQKNHLEIYNDETDLSKAPNYEILTKK